MTKTILTVFFPETRCRSQCMLVRGGSVENVGFAAPVFAP